MTRFFFNLRTAAGIELTDQEGDELLDAAAAEKHAVASASDLMRNSALDWSRASFEIYDDESRHVTTVSFGERPCDLPTPGIAFSQRTGTPKRKRPASGGH
jgi:hypothetical protein